MEFIRPAERLLHVNYRPGASGARPVVFLNSLGTDLRIWDGVVDTLPADLPILRIDKSGHGLSETGAVSITDHAADVAAAMDHFGLKHALICGVSVGGLIAQGLAAQRPDLCAGLILSNTAAKIGTVESWSQRIGGVESGGLESLADAIMNVWFSPGFRETRALDVAGYRTMLTRIPADGYIAVCGALRDADLRDSTAALRLPVTCLAGSTDGSTPTALVQELADSIPGAKLIEFEGVGHLPCIERPAEVANVVRDALEALA